MQVTLADVITEQKGELTRDIPGLVPRAKAAELLEVLPSPLIKVVLGPRRSGKSTLIRMLLQDKSYAYLNFEDEVVRSASTVDIMRCLQQVYGATEYLYFDEIQDYPEWEIFLNKLHRQGRNVIVTGSNARLLSSEIASSLTGRHIAVELFPFSFSEFCAATKRERSWESCELYLRSGGFPEVVCGNVAAAAGYARALFDAIVLKDIVRRYKIRNVEHLNRVISLLVNNIACNVSARAAEKALNGSPTVMTIDKYFTMAQTAYLVELVQRFSFKTRTRVTSPRKAYVVDSAFMYARASAILPLTSKAMETMTYADLRRRGKLPNLDLFTYRTAKDQEVDLVVRDGHRTLQAVQVSFDITQLETREREIRALERARQELAAEQLLLITSNNKETIVVKGAEIEVVPIWQWLQ